MIDRKRHKDRDDLPGEHRYGDAGQIVFFIVFIILWIIDSFILHYSDFASSHISPYVRIPVAGLVLIISLGVAKAGLKIVFGEVRETPQVITKGIFGRVRHPVYLSAILFYLSLVLFTLSIAAAVILVIITLFYHYLAGYEEKILSEEFGNEYEDYKTKVQMWIPRIRRPASPSR